MSELIEIGRHFDRIGANLESAYLESCGLHPTVFSDDLAGLRPHMSAGTGVRVMVPESEREHAIELLEAFRAAVPDITEDDPEDASSAESPEFQAKETIRCAWNASLFGIICLPVIAQVYSLGLIFSVLFSGNWNSLERGIKFRAVAAFAINILFPASLYYMISSTN